jgi:hypothetical protein
MKMTNHVILNNVEHKDIRVIRDRSAEFGDDVMGVPIMPREFRDAQNDFPIFFHQESPEAPLIPYAMFGLQEDENLFLRDASWEATYQPYVLEKGPFLIGLQQKSDGEKGLIISIDLDNPRVSESRGEPVFLPHGGNSPYIERISQLMNMIHEGQGSTERFVNAMLDHDLIEPFALNVELDNGSRHRLEGFHTIHEEKLTELDGDVLADLSRQGFLQCAYMVVASLSNIRKLIQKKNQLLAG